MNRRTSKKKHVGIYRELGFSVDWEYSEGLTEEQRSDFIESFSTFLDSMDMLYGGGCGNKSGGFFICGKPIYKPHPKKRLSSKRSKCVTEEEKKAIEKWLLLPEQRKCWKELKVSDWKDAWYPTEEEDIGD